MTAREGAVRGAVASTCFRVKINVYGGSAFFEGLSEERTENRMTFFMCIDVGSFAAKGVLLRNGETLASIDLPSGGDFRRTSEELRKALCHEAGVSIKEIARVVATGFGAKRVDFADEARLDLLCHAKGISLLLPSVRTVIDVGDLSTKVFRTDGRGGLQNFLLSGKCAGGSGRILQVIAKVLRLKLDEIGDLSLRSKGPVEFQTGCAVFAESEVISRIADGVPKEDLLAGLHRALAAQVNALVERVGIEMEMAVVGRFRKSADTRFGSPQTLIGPEPSVRPCLPGRVSREQIDLDRRRQTMEGSCNFGTNGADR